MTTQRRAASAATEHPGSGLTTSSPAGPGVPSGPPFKPAALVAVSVTRTFAVEDAETLRMRGWSQAAADPDLAAAVGYRADVGTMTPELAIAVLLAALGADELAERAREFGLRPITAVTAASNTSGPIAHLEEEVLPEAAA